MRYFLLIILTILMSCNKNKIINEHISIDINENLTFEEFKKLTEKKALEKDYPDINKWKIK